MGQMLRFSGRNNYANARFFTLNGEIHGELGSVHAMNFGRTHFYSEHDVASGPNWR